MSDLKVYHYASFSDVAKVLGKSREGIPHGLLPQRTIGSFSSPAKDTEAVFALLDPLPDSWLNSPVFSGVWNLLRQQLFARSHTPLLLEIDVDAEDPSVFVGDRGHIESLRPIFRPNAFSRRYPSDSDKAVTEIEFMNSMIPLNEYIRGQNSREISYYLPEVVILEPVQSERIQVSDVQPLLEDGLKFLQGWPDVRERTIRDIVKGEISGELSVWRRNFENKNGPLELVSYGKEKLA